MAQFYQVAGTQLTLPDYVRVDQAVTIVTTPANPAATNNYNYTLRGGYIEIPVAVFARLNTSNAVGARTVHVDILDYLGNDLSITPANSTQAASLGVDYLFAAGGLGAYGPIGTFAAAGFPPSILNETSTLAIAVGNIQTGDQLSAIAVTTVRIPTGPPLVLSSFPLTTPVLA